MWKIVARQAITFVTERWPLKTALITSVPLLSITCSNGVFEILQLC